MPQASLDGTEVLELTQFANKKAWIEDKIQFLSSLDTIQACWPEPPRLAEATAEQLEQWWRQHDNIECEIKAYDMGDLAKLKMFAKKASKQNMSERDADLVEITLVTLRAIDRLMHFLQDRRRSLEQLQSRIEWERLVMMAWKERRDLLDNLPAILSQVRWKPPESTTIKSAPRSSITSLSGSAAGQQLANLELRLRNLSRRTVVSAGKALDAMIDASDGPLPSSFLDAQEELDHAIQTVAGRSALDTDGAVTGFVGQVHAQAQSATRIWDTLQELKTRIDPMTAMPSSVWTSIDEVKAALGDSKTTLELISSETSDLVAEIDALSCPKHTVVPDQDEFNTLVQTRLRDEAAKVHGLVRTAKLSQADLSNAVDLICQAKEAVARSSSLRQESRQLQTLPDREIDCNTFSRARQILEEYNALVKALSALNVKLASNGVHAEVKAQIRQEILDCRAETGRLDTAIKTAEARFDQQQHDQALLDAFKQADDTVLALRDRLQNQICRSAWHANWDGIPDSYEDFSSVAQLLRNVENSITSLAKVNSLFALKQAEPDSATRVDSLSEQLTRTKDMSMLSDRLCRQAQAAAAVLKQLDTQTELDRVIIDWQDKATVLNAQQQLTSIQTRLTSVLNSVLALVPFLASSVANHEPVIIDLDFVDTAIRDRINEASARSKSAVEHLLRKTGVLLKWHQSADSIERCLEHVHTLDDEWAEGTKQSFKVLDEQWQKVERCFAESPEALVAERVRKAELSRRFTFAGKSRPASAQMEAMPHIDTEISYLDASATARAQQPLEEISYQKVDSTGRSISVDLPGRIEKRTTPSCGCTSKGSAELAATVVAGTPSLRSRKESKLDNLTPALRPTSSLSVSSRSATSLVTPLRKSLAPSPRPVLRASSASSFLTPQPKTKATVPRAFSFGTTSRARKSPSQADELRSTSDLFSPVAELQPGAVRTPQPLRRQSAPFLRGDTVTSSLKGRRQSLGLPSDPFGPVALASHRKLSLVRISPLPTIESPAKGEEQPFKPKPLRAVDIEIDRVVNSLDIDIRISAAQGSWNDESGMYWIGNGQSGRLVFCRILRSKSVFVRVGGGWQGLLP
ncbi:hypothetical protein OIV83_002909 [Microbotryomycetes sp. JL201]|nr:hypothetical protein OIV83_002909 [Microbotryomycetes sp. JL201]